MLGAQKNCLIETVLLSTQNIFCFRKNQLLHYALLPGGLLHIQTDSLQKMSIDMYRKHFMRFTLYRGKQPTYFGYQLGLVFFYSCQCITRFHFLNKFSNHSICVFIKNSILTIIIYKVYDMYLMAFSMIKPQSYPKSLYHNVYL